jgi:aryl-alcohol dehydrogenase-like predicted oxidoreductase
MEYRTYPNTDVTVSTVGFGLWTTSNGWWGNMTNDEAIAIMREAESLGITLFEAEDSYGTGRSEVQLAKAFGDRRDTVVYATKFGYDRSPKSIRYALEESLKRLDTDYIDIWQLHNAHLEHVRDGELAALLDDFVREGKLRAWGVALGPAIGWLYEGIEAAQRGITSVQMIRNILEPFPGDAMIDAANKAGSGTGFTIRDSHAWGMLEGKYAADTVFSEKIETLQFLVTPQRTLGQAALQWLLAEPRVMNVLPNMYDRERLHEFAAAPDTPKLTAGERARIGALAATNFGIEEEPMTYAGTMTPPDGRRAVAHA